MDLVSDSKADLFAVSATWLTDIAGQLLLLKLHLRDISFNTVHAAIAEGVALHVSSGKV